MMKFGSDPKFETTGRQLILYITRLDPSQKLVLEYSLQATLPVTAVDGGAEARMYYEPEKKTKAPAKQMKVAAK